MLQTDRETCRGRVPAAVIAAAAFALVLALGWSLALAAQETKPPEWVGIYSTAGKVGLKWNRVEGAVRYRVYRSVSSGKDFKPVATTTDVSYIDAGVRPGETYYYVLRSESSDGGLSPDSGERYITVPVAVGGEPVEPPAWKVLEMEPRRVKLEWEPSGSTRALAYNVYRSQSPDSGFQLIGSTQDSSYVDHDVSDGITYYYRLTTLDKDFTETSFSETRSITYADEAVKRPGKAVKIRPGVQEDLPKKIVAKPTKMVAYITRGKDDKFLLSPTDIALDSKGRIYVSDTGTGYIQIYKQDRKFVKAIGGPGDEDGKFERLLGLDVDKDGLIYAADAWKGRLQKFDPDGKVLKVHEMTKDAKRIAKSLGLKDPITDFGIVKMKVSGDGETIYVIDNYNHCVVMYDDAFGYKGTFGGFGRDDGKLQSPTFVAFSRDGNLLVSDCFNARVQVFDPDGNFLWSFGDYGNVLGSFSRPKGIYVDGDGRIYVSDSMTHAIQVFDENGRFLFLLGDERGRQIDMATPNGIVMDDKGRIYVVEKLVNRVQIRQVGKSD